MSDWRFIERAVERGLDALDALTKQVARVAWALEAAHIDTEGAAYEADPCRVCGSQLVYEDARECSACNTPKAAKADA